MISIDATADGVRRVARRVVPFPSLGIQYVKVG
jgi:hypothetical protein